MFAIIARMKRRGALFLFLTAWIWLGPAYRQVFGGESPYVNRWRMFSGVGLGLLEVKYERELPGGERERLDHYRLLGYRGRDDAPRSLSHITDFGVAQRVGMALCRRLSPGSRVYLQARRAVLDGWRLIIDTDGRDLCARARADRVIEAGHP